MFEVAELGRSLPKADYKEKRAALRLELLQLQQELRYADFPVLVVFAGVDGAGKSETTNALTRWMDSRWIETHAYGEPSQEERERPEFWRYWRDLPAYGRISIVLSSWYHRPVLDRVYSELDDDGLDRALDRITGFEQTLADDGALVLKFWMHLGEKEQKKRLKALEKDPLERWRVTDTAWEHYRRYDDFVRTAEHVIERTSTGPCPWHIVEGTDARFREVAVATVIRDAVRRRLAHRPAPAETAVEPTTPRLPGYRSVLSQVDLSQRMEKKAYKKALKKAHARLAVLQREARDRGVSSVLVFEGWDAAGKGGCIKRLTDVLDARDYRVHAVAAPTDEERAHHYLWRFWRNLGRAGRVTIFDRSWYGRVLVERVEGYATEDEWRRAYAEIRRFEEHLVDRGSVLVKFWLHLSPEEQLARFEAREQAPHKQWKLTDEDWRNRDKWEDYEAAVDAMVERTSTRACPWTLVPADDKYTARIRVIRTFADALQSALAR